MNRTNLLVLERRYFPEATLGILTFPSMQTFTTLENPWKNNATNISCIPEGLYKLCSRKSPIVSRTSKGAYTEGWEVTEVVDRELIMCHIGNFPHNTEGCILIGTGYMVHATHGLSISKSADAFTAFMELLKEFPTWKIQIKTARGGVL